MPIKLKHHRQTPGLCGPASLKILLTHFGKEYSEKELAKLCNATIDFGTDHQDLVKAVKEIGAYCFTKENATIEDLKFFIKNDLPVIVGWWSEDGDHYSVMYDINEENIYLMDPQIDAIKNEGNISMPTKNFLELWYDFEGKNNERKVSRWLMIVTFSPEKFAVKGGAYH